MGQAPQPDNEYFAPGTSKTKEKRKERIQREPVDDLKKEIENKSNEYGKSMGYSKKIGYVKE